VSSTHTHEYKLVDLIDVNDFKETLESFYNATGITNGLCTQEGEPLAQVGWSHACLAFHRARTVSCKHCIESNQRIMEGLQQGEVRAQLCENGLYDYATPVIIEGQHLGTLFMGQVFNEPPDLAFFEQQADQYHYDKARYIESIKAIPVVPDAKMQKLMKCIVSMAEVLAKSGLTALRQLKMEHELSSRKAEAIELHDILEFYPDGIVWHNKQGEIEYINKAFVHMFGYTQVDISTIGAWYKLAFPDEAYRHYIIERWENTFNDVEPSELYVTVTCKDGVKKRIILSARWLKDKLLMNFSDVTTRWQTEQRLVTHNKMLEMVSNGTPITDILNSIVAYVESEDKDAICSILLLKGDRLYTGSSPSLPDFFNKEINGIEIGDGVGSCGTAVYYGQRVIVKDILTHPYWHSFLPLIEKTALRACWSEPIFSSTGKVLGSFAIYYQFPHEPTDNELELISFAANLASVAIENRAAQEELEHRAYYDYLTNLANRRYFIERAESELHRAQRYQTALSMIMLDIDHFKKINDEFGHKMGDKVLQALAKTALATLRDADVIGRIGGEEFAIYLPETHSEQALDVAERLRAALAETSISVNGTPAIQFTVSIGITTLDKNNGVIDSLLQQADKALYQAKKNGRNRVCHFHSLDLSA
jgi:diguanylate cyclase (GGDEF)-like protein/PAS domain S-box-containing protein